MSVLSVMHETQLVSCFNRMLPFWGVCMNSRGEGGVYCPLQPVEDNCSFCPHLMSWPCHKEAAIWRVKQLNFRLISAFHHCPSLVMLCFCRIQKAEVPTYLLQGDEQIQATRFQVLTYCINIAMIHPIKKENTTHVRM